jgi:hypothetical protein
MNVELFPSDANNQRTINQGHPPNWHNPPGGVSSRGYRRRSRRVGLCTDCRCGGPSRRYDGAAVDWWDLR